MKSRSIGFWSWDPIRDAWIKGIAELRVYQKKNKHLFVPERYITETDYALGMWVIKCRMEYKLNKLKKERIRDLETFPDWVWEALT